MSRRSAVADRASGRKAPPTRYRDVPTRVTEGLLARERVPLAAHAQVPVRGAGFDPVEIVLSQAEPRVPELIPIRHGRMAASPFTFYRGAAAVMAADLATLPRSDLYAQLCGDAHLSNFGMFASPERRLVFDINDFDETYPGPWEWDVKRLVASLVVAARANGFGHKARASVVVDTVERYRQAMARFAGMGELEVWYARAELDEVNAVLAAHLNKEWRKRLARAREKARGRDSRAAFRKMTVLVDGRRRIMAEPPLIVPIEEIVTGMQRDRIEAEMRGLVTDYRDSLSDDRRHLLDAFDFVDIARKVVGVGSVGTRCWVVLMAGRDDNDPLLLQVKEAMPSVLMPYVDVGETPDHEGRRVVTGQRLMQAASDIFLGWQRVENGIDGRSHDYYVRQLRDWKGSVIVEGLDPKAMRAYGQVCGWTLARAHARGGDRIAISAYLGDGPELAHALVEFAEGYADLNERDHAAMTRAVDDGRVEALAGV
jgi:uncharacterized protein (DUF2252 family)